MTSARRGEGVRDGEAVETVRGMTGSSPLPDCSLRGALAIREDSGFTRKRRKKTETEGKKLMACESTPSGWVGAREWTPWSQWPTRESTAQEEDQRLKGLIREGRGAHILSTCVPAITHSNLPDATEQPCKGGITSPFNVAGHKDQKSEVTCPGSHRWWTWDSNQSLWLKKRS